ncbi:hypothetical protein Tco_0540119 [Tanacetum coccineum]
MVFGAGTIFDIFQNIHILYLQYGVLVLSRYGVLSLFPLWSLTLFDVITTQQERKTRKDCGTRKGRHSTSSSSAFDQPSSSYLNDDDDDGNDKGTSRASTPSPTYFVNSLTNELRDEYRGGLRSIGKGLKNFDEDVTTIPSPITTSSSPSPPNAPSKTPSTKDTSSTFGTTSSSFESKPQSSPPTFNDTPSPQPSNLFLENVMDAPPRPSHTLPLQSHPSMDINLS